MPKRKVKHRYTESLYEISTVMNSSRNPEDVLTSIVQKVAQTLSAKGCSIMLLTPDHKQMLHAISWGLGDWYIRQGPYPTVRSVSETYGDIPVTVFDVSNDSRLQYPEHQTSILSVPMMLREEVIGWMRVYSSEPRSFDIEEIQLVCAVTNLIAIILENVELYKCVHMDYETIRKKLLNRRTVFSTESMDPSDHIVARDWWKLI